MEKRNTMAGMRTLTAVDIFSGAGGTTQGLRDAGFEVIAAIENDPAAADSYGQNHPDTRLIKHDIERVQAPALARRILDEGDRLDLLTACPPCQPFSTLGTGDADDPRNALVSALARFVRELRPRAVVLENVPGLRRERRFVRLAAEISKSYSTREYVVEAADFGIPQRRRRMIALFVERCADAELPADLLDALPDQFDVSPTTAGAALAEAAELTEAEDPVHRARASKPKTLARIRAIRQGGGRTQLPPHLRLACHDDLEQQSATSVYGRIDPLLPAPTMTTRCTTPSCGRFIHPTEHRGLTLREAALLQTFPIDYEFRGNHGEVERQIGNAFPPKLARAVGLVVGGLLDGGPLAQAA
jgi:DNA-cytosine methyltransferase